MSEPTPRLTLLYMGAYRDTDGDISQGYREVRNVQRNGHFVTADFVNPDDDKLLYFGRKLCSCQPGTVFTIAKTPGKEGSVQMRTDEFVGLWGRDENDRERMEWQARSRAVEHAHEQSKAVEKLKKESLVMETLEPFRRAYSRLNASGRRHLLAEVTRVITSGRVIE